jgi:Uma2 family endonuclease
MSNVAIKIPSLMTVADFLNWPGDGTGVIYELVDGVVRAQDPASDTHNAIFSNLHGHIWQHLRAHRPQCRVVPMAGLQPRLRANWNWRVPEIAVTCTPNRQGVHPTEGAILIVEVLSQSNETDTWGNVPLYASLPTVTEIVLVESTRAGAHLLRREADGSWPKDPTQLSPGEIVGLRSIGLDLPLAEAYAGTWLAAPRGT